MKMKKYAALLLALLLAAGAFTACSDNSAGTGGGAGADDTSAASTEAGEATETDGATVYSANLPEDTDYDGYTFKMMVYNEDNSVWYDVDFNAVAENGDTINDAVYIRMRNVEEKLNVDIVPVPVANYGQAPLRKSVQAKDGAYDAGFVATHGAVNLAEDKLLTDFNKVDDLQLDAPWWDQHAVKDLSIDNRLFMLTGDISIMYKKSLRVVYYNKVLAENYPVKNPYTLMDEHKWTFDEMAIMSKEVSEDLDGDGDRDEKDRYGFVYSIDTIALGLIASEVQFAAKDEDDIPYISFYNDRTQQIWEKYIELLYNKEVSDNCTATGHDGTKMFIEDQALFVCVELHNIERLREMANNFGILPMPLYEETQEEYHCTINPHCAAMLVIPATNTEYTRTANILDELGAQSKNILTPAYYDVYLKGKTTRDNESEVSLDIIFSSIRYDLGYAYNWGTLGDLPLNLVRSYNESLASQYTKIESAAKRALDKTLKNYAEME